MSLVLCSNWGHCHALFVALVSTFSSAAFVQGCPGVKVPELKIVLRSGACKKCIQTYSQLTQYITVQCFEFIHVHSFAKESVIFAFLGYMLCLDKSYTKCWSHQLCLCSSTSVKF